MNGTPLPEWDLTQIRESVGYVNQDPVFFNMSLIENLKVADPNASLEDIKKVLEKVDLWKWISKQPLQLDTNLGTLGGRLSGGQKQRLALARVLLKKNLKLLILDEATAALD